MLPVDNNKQIDAAPAAGQKLVRVEFHCHTTASTDGLITPDGLLEACRRKGIDRVIVTDHNTIAGALAARELDPERVIVGEEIMTTAGELLASFVSQEIPGGLTPKDAVHRLQEQGAFISVSHPFDRFRSPWEIRSLLEILPFIDAIETFNARCLWPGFNKQARRFARGHSLPGTSGSDAHTLEEIGAATLCLPEFDSAESLKEAIRQAKPLGRLSGPWVHIWSNRAKNEKRS